MAHVYSMVYLLVIAVIGLIACPVIYYYYSNIYSKVEYISKDIEDIREYLESETQHTQDMNISEELRAIREHLESVIQYTKDMNIPAELKDIRVRVESVTQDMEKMLQNVKENHEEARRMIEKEAHLIANHATLAQGASKINARALTVFAISV